MKLKERYLEEFEDYLRSMGLNVITYSKYILYYNHFLQMFGEFITQKSIDSFLTTTLKGKTPTPNHRAMIQHLIDFLKRDERLSEEEQLEVSRLTILKRKGRVMKQEIRILTIPEINRIKENSKLSTDFQTERFRIMMMFQYTSGLRINELCGLKFSNLNYQGRTKFFQNGRDKLKYQTLHIPPSLAKGGKGAKFYVRTDVYLSYFNFLKKWSQIEPQVVQKIQLDIYPIWRRNKKKYSQDFKEQVFKTLGFRLPENKSTHILRHSICTHLLAQGMPLLEVRDFMRHSSVSTTERYLHLAKDLVSKGLEKLSSIGNTPVSDKEEGKELPEKPSNSGFEPSPDTIS